MGVSLNGGTAISTPSADHFLVGKPHGFVGETQHFRNPPNQGPWGSYLRLKVQHPLQHPHLQSHVAVARGLRGSPVGKSFQVKFEGYVCCSIIEKMKGIVVLKENRTKYF